ncbi:Ornithine utilization regulator [Pseudohaliea rubra DSM 19751]|uniref:Ornithine utilization regulator n=1 Tax=Pseudohaliea rubra DSM 19751 TaxID=1265313 RepID=A0A095VM43_9GAMM|nr:Ornithine utilization regulator [Pseudohaliea rubra DSM 19751]
MTGRGHPQAAILEGTSLAETGIGGLGARVAQADFARLVANALRLTNDPALGLRLGERLNLSAHAVLGQAFMTCRDLAEVLDLFMRYYHLLSPALELEYALTDRECIITTVNIPYPELAEFGFELMGAAMRNTLRGLLGLPELTLELEFPYPAPAHHDAYRALFGDHVHFERPQGRIRFNRALLRTRLPSSNPALRALYEEECARLLQDLKGADSVAEQTLRLLRKLEGQYPQMPQLARMLNLSPRTYRRRLAGEGESFQTLLDRVRVEHATRHLTQTRLPLSTIAYMVGFNDPSNFRRAFRRWTGRSPAQVRADG